MKGSILQTLHTWFSNSFIKIQFTCATKVHLFILYSSVVLIYSESCAGILLSTFRTFSSTPKETMYLLAITTAFALLPRFWQPPIYFPSLQICLLWAFHTNGIIQYLVFCNQLLSLSMMLSRCCSIYQYFVPFYF